MRDKGSLRQLALFHVTDKEKTFGHDYIPGYTDLFHEKRLEVRNLLEIGIGLGPHYELMHGVHPTYSIGGGLKMWRDYFPNAHIFGLDIYECPISEPNITTVVGDQSKKDDLLRIVEMMGGSLDVVIDDGSHRVDHQVCSFMTLARFISPDGIYVIEDVHSHYIESFKDLSVFPEGFRHYILENFETKWYDTRGSTGLDNDFLMVFLRR